MSFMALFTKGLLSPPFAGDYVYIRIYIKYVI